MVHERQVGVHALELGVLVLQLAKLCQVRDRHARELILPLVVRRLADAVLPARLTNLGAQFDLQLYPDLTYIENNGRGSISFGMCVLLKQGERLTRRPDPGAAR